LIRMHSPIKVHNSVDNDIFVNNSNYDYKPITGFRKERRSNSHSNFVNLKEAIVLLFTIFSIITPIGIQSELQANIVFAQSDISSINDYSENDKSEISSSSSFSQSTSRSNSNKDTLSSIANSGKDNPNTIIFDPSIDLPSTSSSTAADSKAVTQAGNSNEKIVAIDESKNDSNSHGSIQSSHKAYDDSVDSSTDDKGSDNIILHDDNPGGELLSTDTQMDTATSTANDNTNGPLNDKVIVNENQSTVQPDLTAGSQSYGSIQSNNSNSKISSEPHYKSYQDYIDNSNHNSIETDDKPGTELSTLESLRGSVNSNISDDSNQNLTQTASIPQDQPHIQSDSATAQFKIDNQSSNSNSTVTSQPLYKSYRDFIEHNKANKSINYDNGISSKSVVELNSADAASSQISAQSSNEVYGDFNGDGRDDLAIGVPGENRVPGESEGAGAVNVLYGSSNGLSATSPRSDQFWTQNSADINDASEVDDTFGSSLASGDFNGDGRDDLAIGVPGESVNSQPFAGGVEVIYGSSNGLSATSPRPDQFWTQNSADVNGASEIGDSFGFSVTSGDFNADGKDDLAIGVPNESEGGAVNVLYGSSNGLSATSPRADQFWTQNTADVNDVSETGDDFGNSLTSGDFNNDGKDDLAVGVQGESLSVEKSNAGAVEVIYGSSSGLSATSPRADQFWTQDTANVDDVAERDAFGWSLTSGDFNGDGKDDLAIGARWEKLDFDSEAGAVQVIYGSSSGLSATSPRGDQFWTQDTPDVNDVAESEDQFGFSTSAGDFNGDGKDDLAIGVWDEDVDIGGGDVDEAGGVEVIYGSSSGLSATSPRADQFWTQDSANIDDVPERPDEFGSAVYSGDFNGDGKDDLAIGVPQEDVGSISSAGAVEVIYGSSSGLSATSPRADQFWTQNSADVNDVTESGDHFGRALG
jgi:hypothetical protein